MMVIKKHHRLPLVFFGISLVCSLTSLALLIRHPEGPGKLPGPLNTVAISLVLAGAVLGRDRSGQGDA
jgi:hypothetical protein